MKIRIIGRPHFQFSLTNAQLRVLIACAGAHYDAECIAAAHIGGFLYGWRNMDGRNITATWGNIDLCLKIMEIIPPTFYTRDAIVASRLREAFHAALKQASKDSLLWEFNIET